MIRTKECEELLLKEETNKFLALMYKIDKEKPDPKDLREAENMVSKNPALWQVGLGYSGSVLDSFINNLNPNKQQQLIIKAEVLSIKEKLGYNTASQSERLIIDQIMLCWASMNYVEGRVHSLLRQSGYPLSTGEYWQENLTHYQKRYLGAVETLARIRKLNKGMVLQVNIATEGGKQVNVNKGD